MAAKRVRLAQRRKAAGYSQEKLAERLGVERSTVVRWETAETEPQPWQRPKLARLLNVTLEELQALLADVTIKSSEPDERLRRALQQPSQVDLVVAAQLHEQLRRLDEQYDRTPSTALLGSAGQLHGQVTLLRQNAMSTRIRRALYEVEAESATFMSQLVWDVSQRRDHKVALAYLDEADAAARHIHDPALQAYATLRKSFVFLYGAQDPETGVRLATEASGLARSSSTALAGLSLLHVAEGLAMMDDGAACDRALGRAEALLDEPTPDDLAAEYYSRSEYERLAGSCYLSLDLPERAETVLRPTVDSLASKQKSQAIAYGNLTLSLIRQRKLDEAADTMHRTIDTIELTRGGGGLAVAFTAGRELRPWQHEPWVGDVHDRLLALIATL